MDRLVFKKIIFCITVFLSFSSCVTFNVTNRYTTEEGVIFEEYNENKTGHIIITCYISTPVSPWGAPFIGIYNEHFFEFNIETKNYEFIKEIKINEMKVITKDGIIDILDGIEIYDSSIKKNNYIIIGEEEYKYFEESRIIRLFPYDEIHISNKLDVNYSKIRSIEIRVSLKFYYDNDEIIYTDYILFFKKKSDIRFGTYFGP